MKGSQIFVIVVACLIMHLKIVLPHLKIPKRLMKAFNTGHGWEVNHTGGFQKTQAYMVGKKTRETVAGWSEWG